MKIETVKDEWVVIDGIKGVEIYPMEYFSITDAIEAYGFSGICSIEVSKGWGARLSSPGYLDCTEWTGPFLTKKAAVLNMKDQYNNV